MKYIEMAIRYIKQRGLLYAIFKIMNRIKKILNTYRYQARDIVLRVVVPQRPSDAGRKISVIIPTLSRGEQADRLPGLRKLLSVYLPDQTHKNYEVIVYCDGPNKDVEKMAASLGDHRIKVYFTDRTMGKYGHPQTRMAMNDMTGDFFVRMNDDNRPYKDYLQTLVNGFDRETGIVYGRIVYRGEARNIHGSSLSGSFIIPGDKNGTLRVNNIDCMNYMIKSELAKKYVNFWNDEFAADWFFLEAMLKDGIKARFIDRIIGEKF